MECVVSELYYAIRSASSCSFKLANTSCFPIHLLHAFSQLAIGVLPLTLGLKHDEVPFEVGIFFEHSPILGIS